jgi:hypothetical protein
VCAGARSGVVYPCESFIVPSPITNKRLAKEGIRTAAAMLCFRVLHKAYLNKVAQIIFMFLPCSLVD